MKADPVPKAKAVSDLSAQPIFAPCLHRNLVVDTSGGRRFRAGEVEDDILVCVLCLDCREYLTEAEVRAAWGQENDDPMQFLQVGESHEDQ